MRELEWEGLVNGESDVDADDINKLAEYIKELNKNKVDTVTGKGLSTEDFTTALKDKLEGLPDDGGGIPLIEIKSGAGYLNWEELTEMDVPEGVSIIYSVDLGASTYEYGLLIKSLGDYEQLVVMRPNGEICEIHRDYYTGEWLEWTSPYVTPTDLDNAIGDIETSLENIIKKYGLGGDSV